MIVGYARVSSVDQSLDLQLGQLKDAGAEKIFAEQVTGTTTAGRGALAGLLEWIREGDVVLVTRLDRIARSIVDLHQILAAITAKGATFRCIHQPVENETPTGKLMLSILGAFAEFETAIRKERQMEGIAKAKANGVYGRGGVPKILKPEQVIALKETGLGAAAIARTLGVSRKTVYRAAPGIWGLGVGKCATGEAESGLITSTGAESPPPPSPYAVGPPSCGSLAVEELPCPTPPPSPGKPTSPPPSFAASSPLSWLARKLPRAAPRPTS